MDGVREIKLKIKQQNGLKKIKEISEVNLSYIWSICNVILAISYKRIL